MKRRLPSFFAGMLTMLLICSLTVSALAISGRMTLEVEPINVMVNGEVFQPKDGLGRDVPVFVYNGTTYAPLRALAEAYGLEVGYDKAQNLATVTDPRAAQASTPVGVDMDYSDWSEEEEKAYQEFKSMWNIEELMSGYGEDIDGKYSHLYALYNGDFDKNGLKTHLNKIGSDKINKFAERMMFELHDNEDVLYLHYKLNKDDFDASIWTTSITRDEYNSSEFVVWSRYDLCSWSHS